LPPSSSPGIKLHFQLTCGLTALAFSAASVAAQTTPVKSVPIRGGSQPFAITMGEMAASGSRFPTVAKVARIIPNGSISYARTPSLSNPAFITPGPDGKHLVRRRLDGQNCFGQHRMESSRNISSPFFGVSVGITTGSDGNIWFTDQTIMPSGVTSSRPALSRNSQHPHSFLSGDITTGSDATCGSTEQAVDKFGRITPDG